MTLKKCTCCGQTITTRNAKKVTKTTEGKNKILWIDCNCGGSVVRIGRNKDARVNTDYRVAMSITRG